jgi:hypothetical protein
MGRDPARKSQKKSAKKAAVAAQVPPKACRYHARRRMLAADQAVWVYAWGGVRVMKKLLVGGLIALVGLLGLLGAAGKGHHYHHYKPHKADMYTGQSDMYRAPADMY